MKETICISDDITFFNEIHTTIFQVKNQAVIVHLYAHYTVLLRTLQTFKKKNQFDGLFFKHQLLNLYNPLCKNWDSLSKRFTTKCYFKKNKISINDCLVKRLTFKYVKFNFNFYYLTEIFNRESFGFFALSKKYIKI